MGVRMELPVYFLSVLHLLLVLSPALNGEIRRMQQQGGTSQFPSPIFWIPPMVYISILIQNNFHAF